MHYDTFSASLAKTIHLHRKAMDLTQAELAEYAGVGKTVIFDIEHGKNSVKLNTLLSVLKALNISLSIQSPFLNELTNYNE